MKDSRRLSTAFLLMGALLIVSIAFTYMVGRRATLLADQVSHRRELIDHLGNFLATLVDAETGQRGYILTGDIAYLTPYQDALNRLPADMQEIQAMADREPDLSNEVHQIMDQVPHKLDVLSMSLEAYKKSGPNAAQTIVASNQGKRLMDDIRRSTATCIAAQQLLLSTALQNATDAARLHSLVMGSVACLDLAFLLWMYRRIRSEMRRRAIIADELADQKEFLDVTLGSIGDGVLIADTNANVIFLNAVAQKLTGWSSHEAMGKPCADIFNIINEESRQRVPSPVEKVLQTGTLVGLANHTLLIRRDGTETPIDDSGAPIRDMRGTIRGVVLVFRDFSEHRSTEAQIRRLNAQLQRKISEWETVFDLVPAGLILADDPECKVIHRNPALLKLLRSADPRFEDPNYQGPAYRVESRPIPLNQMPLYIAAREGRAIIDLELDLIFDTGRVITLYGGAAPLRDQEGKLDGAIGAFLDITQMKRVESELREANQAKDQFLATLSHELRTPLTPVLGTLSSWEASPNFPEFLRPDVQMLRRNIELEARLIDDLLDITRIARGRMVLTTELADAHSLIRAIASMYSSETQAKRLDVQIHLGAPRHVVMADPARLQQVFWNILKNATKFTPESGSITITTTNDLANNLHVTVADTGIGMDQQTLENVFHPFEPRNVDTVRRFGGLGLGMSIAKTLIEAQGGTITGASAGLGLGSTFTITIPVVASPAPSPASDQPHVTTLVPSAPRSMNILLVEDHPDSARVLGRLLRGLGHQVTIASSVAEAITNVDAGLDINLLLSDIGLPDGTGIDLIRHVRTGGHTFPAIAITGFGMDEDIHKCHDAGFNSHLTKPVNFQKLELLIQQFSHA